MTRKELVDEVKRVLAAKGLEFEGEYLSPHRSMIIGRQRRADVAVMQGGEPVLFIECKAQEVRGTAEEKFFRALEEAKRDRDLGIASIIVFAGDGWSPDMVRHGLVAGAVPIELFEPWVEKFFFYQPAPRRASSS